MGQPQHSLTPHLDSFTKSSQNLPPPKPHQKVLRRVVRSLSLGYACSSGLSRAWQAERMCFVAGREAVGCWELSSEGALITDLLSDSILWPPSVVPSMQLSSLQLRSCGGDLWWTRVAKLQVSLSQWLNLVIFIVWPILGQKHTPSSIHCFNATFVSSKYKIKAIAYRA